MAITYTLRPKEKPTGGEGRKVEDAVCGVIVDASGLIITSADPFPDPGGDPKTTLTPVEFKVHLRGGHPVDAEAVGLDRELNLAYLRLKSPPPEVRPLRFAENARLDGALTRRLTLDGRRAAAGGVALEHLVVGEPSGDRQARVGAGRGGGAKDRKEAGSFHRFLGRKKSMTAVEMHRSPGIRPWSMMPGRLAESWVSRPVA